MSSFDPHVSFEHMPSVVWAWTIKQPSICLSVEPSVIVRPVGVANETRLIRVSPPEQSVAHRAGIEVRSRIHHGWVTPCDFLMAQGGVEIIRDPRFQPLKVNID